MTLSEADRLEALWSGDFGNDYVERNLRAYNERGDFWTSLLSVMKLDNVLEVGCNVGGNLHWLAQLVDPLRVYGVDINAQALREVRETLPDVNAVRSPARSLPFRDGLFDLTFTTTVLIHQPPDALPIVMNEVVRTSRRLVLCGEYHADELTEVPYRGETGALFKRDWGALYQSLFPELKLLETRFEADPGDGGGWDDVTFWLFEKT